MKLSKLAIIISAVIVGTSILLIAISQINPPTHLIIKNIVMFIISIISLVVAIGLIASLLYGLFLLYGILYLAFHDNKTNTQKSKQNSIPMQEPKRQPSNPKHQYMGVVTPITQVSKKDTNFETNLNHALHQNNSKD